jgi:predicted enzyme related to lactoylglutathione lyase
MNPHVNAILLGVGDIDRAKKFYSEGLGWPIEQDHARYVAFSSGEGSSALGLYPRADLAGDAGVPAEGSGFAGITLNHFVPSEEAVDAVLAEAERAGGKVLKPGAQAQWGGYSGHFADPDGFVWKVVATGAPG